jgi:hypothetical protein
MKTIEAQYQYEEQEHREFIQAVGENVFTVLESLRTDNISEDKIQAVAMTALAIAFVSVTLAVPDRSIDEREQLMLDLLSAAWVDATKDLPPPTATIN